MKRSILKSVFLLMVVSLIGEAGSSGGRNNGPVKPLGAYDPDGIREIEGPDIMIRPEAGIEIIDIKGNNVLSESDTNLEKKRLTSILKEYKEESKKGSEKTDQKTVKLSDEDLKYLNHLIILEGKNSTHDEKLKDYAEYATSKTLSAEEQNTLLLISSIRYLYNHPYDEIQDAAKSAYEHVILIHNCDEKRKEDCEHYLIVSQAREHIKPKSHDSES